MSPVVSEILRSGFMINSSLRRRTHLVQSFSVNSGSEEDLQHLMDQRKRKRMESNRESARRSRMRKQKHLDDLVSQVTQLRKDNNQILTSINFTTQHYLNIEAENSVLRAQMMELSQRLESLSEILDYLNSTTTNGGLYETHQGFETSSADSFTNPFNLPYLNQPIMASADIFQY
ncbi:Basic-leucine zipper domain - like 10 [Theobroma cacao]|nr:Basic-leucine zipper domain - like 10 [Theobroma cacao]